MPRILKTPRAERDLVSIGAHIAQDNPRAADKLLNTLGDTFQMLAIHPLAGQSRDDLAPEVRSFPVGKYLIFYLPLADGIAVVRVIHGARDHHRIFRGQDGTK